MPDKITKARIRHLADTETAYLAGIIDGEGCIHIRQRGKVLFPILAITNTSEPLIEWLRGLCENRIRPLAASRHTKRQAYQIEWAAMADVLSILRSVLPWLIVKRDKAREAIAILEAR